MAKTKSYALIDDNVLLISPSLAERIGLGEAIVIQQVHYWLKTSKHIIDDRKWIYNTYEEWGKQFPFWSTKTVERNFRSLVEKGLLIRGNYNKMKRDRTFWYAINYEKLDAVYLADKDKELRKKRRLSKAGQGVETKGQNVLIPKHLKRTKCPNDKWTKCPNGKWTKCPNVEKDKMSPPLPKTTENSKHKNTQRTNSLPSSITELLIFFKEVTKREIDELAEKTFNDIIRQGISCETIALAIVEAKRLNFDKLGYIKAKAFEFAEAKLKSYKEYKTYIG